MRHTMFPSLEAVLTTALIISFVASYAATHNIGAAFVGTIIVGGISYVIFIKNHGAGSK